MRNNEHPPIIRSNGKCTDIEYLILTTLFVGGLLTYAIISFDLPKLRSLSMPRNTDGQICQQLNQTHPLIYVSIEGPTINNRSCVNHCEQSQPNMQLGGVCISAPVKQILQQTGQYSHYIQPKLNALQRFNLISKAIVICTALSLLISVLVGAAMGCGCTGIGSGILIVISVVLGGGCLYWLYKQLVFAVWLALCIVYGLYVLYVIIWRVFRSSHSLSNLTQSISPTAWMVTSIVLTVLTVIIIIGFICLLIFEYLSFTSQSPHFVWTSPALYAEVTALTWKQILVLVQAAYLISFTSVLYQYMVGSLYSNNLGFSNIVYSLFRAHLGSVCKLAIIRLVLFLPIFLLTLAKPLEGQKCADPCHCLCGYLLNFTRKYSLPVLAYQSAMRESIPLSQAADRLHYEAHINKMEYSQGYIERMAIYVIIATAAAATVLYQQNRLQLEVSLLTLALSVVLGLWVASVFASSWIYAKEGRQVRSICQKNRDQSTV